MQHGSVDQLGTLTEVLQQFPGHLGGGAALRVAQLRQLLVGLVEQPRDVEAVLGGNGGTPPGTRAEADVLAGDLEAAAVRIRAWRDRLPS